MRILEIGKRCLNVLNHQPVVVPRGLVFLRTPCGSIGHLGYAMGTIRVFVPKRFDLGMQLVLARTGRPEVGVQRLAAPGRLDDQNRTVNLFAHGDTERQLRATHRFATQVAAIAHGQRAALLFMVSFARLTVCDDAYILVDPWFAARIDDLVV